MEEGRGAAPPGRWGATCSEAGGTRVEHGRAGGWAGLLDASWGGGIGEFGGLGGALAQGSVLSTHCGQGGLLRVYEGVQWEGAGKHGEKLKELLRE